MGVRLNQEFNCANVASTMKKKMTYEDFTIRWAIVETI